VNRSPSFSGSGWFGDGILGFLVFPGVDEFIVNFLSFFDVLSNILLEIVLDFLLSEVVCVSNLFSSINEFGSVGDVSFDVSLHSSFSGFLSSSWSGSNSGEEGGNHNSRLFHFGF
jgi:hypothetical protein